MDAFLQDAAHEAFDGNDGALYQDKLDNSGGDERGDNSNSKYKPSTIEILQRSAQQVMKEDAVETKEVFAKQVKELAPVIKELQESIDTHNFVVDVAEQEKDYEDDYEKDEYEKENRPKSKLKIKAKQEDVSDDEPYQEEDGDDEDFGAQNSEEKRKGFELLLACRSGDSRQVNSLLKKGASLYYRDRHNW
jgi:hypothetical protein